MRESCEDLIVRDFLKLLIYCNVKHNYSSANLEQIPFQTSDSICWVVKQSLYKESIITCSSTEIVK